jgi:phage/plasmid-like protein (TIGR03299 family)
MAHAITQRDTGIYEFCFSGSRSAIWHGLGQELSEDSPIDVWKVEAGMNWQVRQAPMMFMNADNEPTAVEARKILYRSDNAFQLGIVGEDYKIVQPGQVLEFFDDLTRLHGMKLSTAGTLFGGKHFWALAKTGQKTDVLPGDEVDAYVLLTTSADGTAATQARFTSTRVVCNNTLNIALAEKAKKMVKVTHHREWDATQVKIDLGLLGKSWADFTANMERLTKIAMDEKATRAFYQKIFFNPDKLAEDQALAERRIVDKLMEKAFGGIGSEMSASLSGLKKIFW